MNLIDPQDEVVEVSGGRVLDGDWVELEGGILRTEFEGACGEAYVGAQRLIPARGAIQYKTYRLPKYWVTHQVIARLG